MADKPYHTQVRVIVEELDEDGKVIEETSSHVLADFPDDSEPGYCGTKSDSVFHEVISKCGGR